MKGGSECLRWVHRKYCCKLFWCLEVNRKTSNTVTDRGDTLKHVVNVLNNANITMSAVFESRLIFFSELNH